MTAEEIISTVVSMGGSLEPNGDRIKFRGPKGVLTAELEKEISENKPEILAALDVTDKQIDVEAVNVLISVDPSPHGKVYLLPTYSGRCE